MCWRIVRIQGDGSIKLILSSKNTTCENDDKDSIIAYTSYGGHRADKTATKLDYENPSYGVTYGDVRIENSKTYLKHYLDNFYNDKLIAYQNKLKKERICLEHNIDNENGTATIDNTKLICDEGDKSTNPLYIAPLMYSEVINSRDKDISYLDYILTYFKNGYVYTNRDVYEGVSSYVNTASFWTITPENINNSFYAYTDSGKNIGLCSLGDYFGSSSGARPAIVLNEGTTITKGNGTMSDPYVIN